MRSESRVLKICYLVISPGTALIGKAAAQERHRRAAGEDAELSLQMRLIGITGGGGQIGQTRHPPCADESNGAVKPQDAG